MKTKWSVFLITAFALPLAASEPQRELLEGLVEYKGRPHTVHCTISEYTGGHIYTLTPTKNAISKTYIGYINGKFEARHIPNHPLGRSLIETANQEELGKMYCKLASLYAKNYPIKTFFLNGFFNFLSLIS